MRTLSVPKSAPATKLTVHYSLCAICVPSLPQHSNRRFGRPRLPHIKTPMILKTLAECCKI
jgi:hypothetical protein